MRKFLSQMHSGKALTLLACLGVAIVANFKFPMQLGDNWLDVSINVPGLLSGILFVFGATALVPMLLQQSLAVRKLRYASETLIPRSGFTLNFAIVWRIAVALILATSLLAEILVFHQLLSWPPSDLIHGGAYGWGRLEYIKYACIIVALGACLETFRPTIERGQPLWKACLDWLASTLLSLLILPHGMLILFLVYAALNGIEAAHPAKFQRAGTYPNFHATDYGLSWLALAAAVSIAFSAALWITTLTNRGWNKIAISCVRAVATALLCFSGYFAYWFFTQCLPAMSPELGQAGLESRWWHWTEAGILLLILIPAGAFRIASSSGPIIETHRNTALASSLLRPIVIALTVSGVLYFVSLYVAIEPFADLLPELLDFFFTCLTYIDVYFPLAVLILSFSLLLMLRRNGKTPSSFRFRLVDPHAFFAACAVLIALTAVGIPTVAAYSFCYWLRPLL